MGVGSIASSNVKTNDELEWECIDLQAKLEGLQQNYEMQKGWLMEWKRTAEALKASQPGFLRLVERLEQVEKCCAEMREAYKSFDCTICDENHKFRPECNACLSGQPEACTCCNEELIDCPCCMEGDYAEGYKKLRHALSTDCGKNYVHKSELEKLREAVISAEQFIAKMSGNGETDFRLTLLTALKEKESHV